MKFLDSTSKTAQSFITDSFAQGCGIRCCPGFQKRILGWNRVPKRESILSVLTMSPLSDRQIDEAILSVTKESWRKVAFVIATVADAIGGDRPEGDAAYDLIAKRIEVLVRGGRLLAQGDTKKWRHSEVRKAI